MSEVRQSAEYGASTLKLAGAGRLSGEQFGTLYLTHSRKLWCVAAAVTGDRVRAMDVVQEAVVVALGKLNEFDPATSFAAWMSQIVRFVALNESRRNRRDGKSLTDPAVMDGSPSRDLAVRDQPLRINDAASLEEAFDDQVCAALAALDETPRACVLMKTVLGLSYAEISESLGIPEGTAMSHVHRARRALREALSASADQGIRRDDGSARRGREGARS